MKKYFRIFAIVMAAVLTLAVLVSCGKTQTPAGTGSDAGNDAPADEVKGAMDEHGYYKVFVPEGYTLKHEDVFGDESPKSFSINSDEATFSYFNFNIFTEENAKDSVDMTKEINEGAEDVTLDLNGVKWTGVAYNSLGYDCFSLYADFDGNFVLVNGAGNAYDGALVKAVLGSLEVNVTE